MIEPQITSLKKPKEKMKISLPENDNMILLSYLDGFSKTKKETLGSYLEGSARTSSIIFDKKEHQIRKIPIRKLSKSAS